MVAVVAFQVAIGLLTRSFFDRLYFILVPMSFAVCALFIVGMTRFSGSRGVLRLFWWYFAVGLLSVFTVHAFRQSGLGGILSVEMLPLWLLLLVTVYSETLYGELRPELGGGAPTPVVLYLSGPR